MATRFGLVNNFLGANQILLKNNRHIKDKLLSVAGDYRFQRQFPLAQTQGYMNVLLC